MLVDKTAPRETATRVTLGLDQPTGKENHSLSRSLSPRDRNLSPWFLIEKGGGGGGGEIGWMK